jgi:hypothetical protein
MAPPAGNPRTFISYAREDSEFALKLATDLRAAGADIWLDRFDITVGDPWPQAIDKALDECGQFLVILTRASTGSQNVMAELNSAVDEGKRILPVLREECRIPFRIRAVHYANFTGDYESGLAELLPAIGVRQTPPRPPVLPPVDVAKHEQAASDATSPSGEAGEATRVPAAEHATETIHQLTEEAGEATRLPAAEHATETIHQLTGEAGEATPVPAAEPAIQPHPPPQPPRRSRLRYGLVIGSIALTAAFYWIYSWYQTPAEIESFTSSTPVIHAGQSVTLTWRVRHARSVWLTPPGPDYLGQSDGSLMVTPSAEEGDMEYKLWVEGRAGPSKGAEKTVTVRVLPKSEEVQLAKMVAIAWYRAYLDRDDPRVAMLANEPFYFFGARLDNREALRGALHAATPQLRRPSARGQVDGKGVWTSERFRTGPLSVSMSPEERGEVLGSLGASPDDLVVVLRLAPGSGQPMTFGQEVGLGMSKRSGRWLALGVFDLSSRRARPKTRPSGTVQAPKRFTSA